MYFIWMLCSILSFLNITKTSHKIELQLDLFNLTCPFGEENLNLCIITVYLTLLVPKKSKKFTFEIQIIPPTLNITNQRTACAKSINLDIIRNLIEYSFNPICYGGHMVLAPDSFICCGSIRDFEKVKFSENS